MKPKKPNRRKISANKLEPIDWHEFANDAVLNGNMSTLFRRPPTEDPTAYASPEALIEIEKRITRSQQLSDVDGVTSPDRDGPTVGVEGSGSIQTGLRIKPTVGKAPRENTVPTVGPLPGVGTHSKNHKVEAVSLPLMKHIPPVGCQPTVGIEPTVGVVPTVGNETVNNPAGIKPTAPTLADDISATRGAAPTVGPASRPGLEHAVDAHTAPTQSTLYIPTVGPVPAVGLALKRKVKPIRNIQDALTLAGQVLYGAMAGSPDGSGSKSCTKGYRQLAAETRLDKDTVRDLIVEFKEKGIVRETATYDPDTRLAKTYEILSPGTILQIWREAGLLHVTAGRQRPQFCSPQGEPIIPTVGPGPTRSQ